MARIYLGVRLVTLQCSGREQKPVEFFFSFLLLVFLIGVSFITGGLVFEHSRLHISGTDQGRKRFLCYGNVVCCCLSVEVFCVLVNKSCLS